MPDQLIRRIPRNLSLWIERERKDQRKTKQEFVLRMLERARELEERDRLPLFHALPPRPVDRPVEGIPFTYVDLFAGIGGFRMALDRLGGQCRLSVEWDKYCQKTYRDWFGETPKGDIRKIKPADIPDHDILAAGFPCQPFSTAALEILAACRARFGSATPDDRLMEAMEAEYGLFRFVERRLCEPEILRTFADVDDFLKTAAPIMNRRKARAGRSLENHVGRLLAQAGIPHEMRPASVPGRPDVVIPDARSYLDGAYPIEKLFVVGVKTTCKDRWRQVLNEGRRVPDKHIITVQPGISASQMEEMRDARVASGPRAALGETIRQQRGCWSRRRVLQPARATGSCPRSGSDT